MKSDQRTTISLYGTTYKALCRYKKQKEETTGYRLTFQQVLAMLLKETKSDKNQRAIENE